MGTFIEFQVPAPGCWEEESLVCIGQLGITLRTLTLLKLILSHCCPTTYLTTINCMTLEQMHLEPQRRFMTPRPIDRFCSAKWVQIAKVINFTAFSLFLVKSLWIQKTPSASSHILSWRLNHCM